MDSVEIVWCIPATLVMQNERLLKLLPKKEKTRPPNMNGILYQLKNGCNWCDLPRDLPPYSTVYWHDKQWRAAGVLTEFLHRLHQQVREIPMDNPNHH